MGSGSPPQKKGIDFQDLLKKKYQKKSDNPMGLVMGPSGGGDPGGGFVLPDLGNALMGL